MSSAADLFQSASAARAAGNLEAAASGYAAAIELRPDMAEAYLNSGWVLSELGRKTAAIAAYDHGLRFREWPPATAAAARTNLGSLLHELGRTDEATQQFKLALDAKPDFGPALNNLDPTAGSNFGALIGAANGHLERGENAQAADLYRQAISLRDPRIDGSAYVGLGAALHGARKVSLGPRCSSLREAGEVLNAGAKLNPSGPGMMHNLATVLADLGKNKASAKAWRRHLALRPDDALSYRSAYGPTKLAWGARAALPLLASASRLEPTNWHNHYTAAHGYLHAAFWEERGAADVPDPELAASAFAALRPLHRLPISLTMRSEGGARPPWERNLGKGLLGDEPPPLPLESILHTQAARRAEAASAGRQRGLIVYKLGPKKTEVEHLKLSLLLLMRYHNRAFRYPILIAHDEVLDASLRDELTDLAEG